MQLERSISRARRAAITSSWLLCWGLAGSACQETPSDADDGGALPTTVDVRAVDAEILDALAADAADSAQAAQDAWPSVSDAAAAMDAAIAPPDAQGVRAEIVEPRRWVRVDASVDPFGDRPATVDCDEQATYAETFSGVSAYEIDTAYCNYATLHQLTTQDIRTGDRINARFVHFPLTAPEDSEAHVVVRIEELAVLEERIPIPSDAGVLVRDLIAPRDIPAGANAYLHVHNHGANAYVLVSFSAGP